GTAQIKETGSNFETINIAVSGMAQKITAISGNLKGIADKNSHMNHTIENIASVSEKSASGVEQAAASAQHTSSSMAEITNSADELANLAEKMNTTIQGFKL